jgi:hypothetical protein
MSLFLRFQLIGAHLEGNLDWMGRVTVGDEVYFDH